MQKTPYVQTSVFVDDKYPFGGNQLATFWDTILNKRLTRETMQGIALELNFSETTFLEEPTVKGCDSRIRIFTPGRELEFAGHPTLGSSFVMKHKGIVAASQNSAVVQLGIGPIRVDFQPDNHVRMTQPSPTFSERVKDTSPFTYALGLNSEDISDAFPIQVVSTGFPYVIVPLRNLSAVQRATPSAQLIMDNLKDLSTSEILIFSTETVHPNNDVHARMFAPDVGVLEDPATGSAAGPLGAYLERYSVLKKHTFGEPIQIEQGYEVRKPSRLTVTVPHEDMEEVLVSGKVRLVAEGTLYVS
ncbi:MAG: phenazine biosynthesis protein [Candidatus Thorarchaeota archaeon]|nr:MAG: phenazine biosynthesis protein [Candidatus Thorarchaeota archaeon]